MAKSEFDKVSRELMSERYRLFSSQKKRFNGVRGQCEYFSGDELPFKCSNKGHAGIGLGHTNCTIKVCPYLNPSIRFGPRKPKERHIHHHHHHTGSRTRSSKYMRVVKTE